ncbi:MAG: hypothetical protein GY778_04800 [bacterium]|nr:hypothetical protein [bacterium]
MVKIKDRGEGAWWGPRWPGIGLLLGVIALSGCGTTNVPNSSGKSDQNDALESGDSEVAEETNIAGDVATAEVETGLPSSLSGTLSGGFQGAYDEDILEIFFDADGLPLAAVSRSVFTLDGPLLGSLTSVNQIVILEVILTDDEAGQPVPIGLRTAATGEIIYGTGEFEAVTGQVHSDSTVTFGGGEFGLGTLDASLEFSLEP